MTLTICIIGNGFVGSSVSNGFNINTEQTIVDPQHTDTTITQALRKKPDVIFVCVPTPEGPDGDIDVTIVREVLAELHDSRYNGIVVLKSTITPNYLTEMVNSFDVRIVYNPEFLTERNAQYDFINPHMTILGGDWNDCSEVEQMYINHSSVKMNPTFKTDVVSASLIKYTLNTFFATKVTFMNEIKKVHDVSGATTHWNEFTEMLSHDPRMGSEHLQVPGHDGMYGWGGNCFPKDTKAMLKYAETLDCELDVLETAVNKNNKIRN